MFLLASVVKCSGNSMTTISVLLNFILDILRIIILLPVLIILFIMAYFIIGVCEICKKI